MIPDAYVVHDALPQRDTGAAKRDEKRVTNEHEKLHWQEGPKGKELLPPFAFCLLPLASTRSHLEKGTAVPSLFLPIVAPPLLAWDPAQTSLNFSSFFSLVVPFFPVAFSTCPVPLFGDPLSFFRFAFCASSFFRALRGLRLIIPAGNDAGQDLPPRR